MLGQEICPSKTLVVVMHRENLVEGRFVWVDVDHPAEDRGAEAAAGGIASVLRGDGAFEAELRPVGRLQSRGQAQIRMQMPHRDAERDSLVQLILRSALRHGVHRAD